MLSEVNEQSTNQWTPAATDLEINTNTIVSYTPSTIPPFYTSPALGEPGFNLKPQKSIAPTYSAWKTHSIYRLPGSTTLSLVLPPSGEYIQVKYEPPPNPNFVVKFIGEMWHLTKVIVGYILWMIFIITVIFIWLRFYF
jgi:hypothetical protein